MRRALASLAIGLAAGAFVLSAYGDAPPDQYELFQPSTTTIRDTKSGLEWERFPERNFDAGLQPLQLDHAQASARCQSYGPGWRLPTVKELLTIVDEEPHDVYTDGSTRAVFADPNAFPTTFPDEYWSSTLKDPMTGRAVNFGTGETSTQQASIPRYVRCVKTKVTITDSGAD